MKLRALLLFCGLSSLVCLAPSWAEEPFVTIVSPSPEPAYGRVLFEVEAAGKNLVEVELLVDGKRVALLKSPPFRLEIDLGDENRAHRFEAIAVNDRGEKAQALMETPPIRVDDVISAELQQLYVTVTADQRRVLDLTQEDFAIIDNGVQQETVTFAKGDIPLAAAVLIDASKSMAGERLRSALRGAETFLQAMRPGDETAVILFSDRWIHQTPFSGDSAGLIAGLAGARAAGGTALNDTLYLALKRLEDQQGRRVIILLSDGVDTHSALETREVAWLAQRSRALIYWIRTENEVDQSVAISSSWKGPETYREERRKLWEVVQESGGRVVQLAQIEDAGAAFKEILAELREQYVLGYYPSDNRNDGGWHRITVRTRREGVELRTRNGYLDH